MGKDVGQDVFGGDFADYVGEVVDALAYVLAQEVAGIELLQLAIIGEPRLGLLMMLDIC